MHVRKSKAIIVILILFIIITKIIVVSGGVTAHLGQGETNQATSCTTELCWNDAILGTSSTYLEGIRVSVVNLDGTRLSGTKSVNYAKYDEQTEIKAYNHVTTATNLRMSTANLTKIEIAKNYKNNSLPQRTSGPFQFLEKYIWPKEYEELKLPKIYKRSGKEPTLKEYFERVANPKAPDYVKGFFKTMFVIN